MRTSMEVAFVHHTGKIIRTIVLARPDHVGPQGQFTVYASPTMELVSDSNIVVDMTNKRYVKHRHMSDLSQSVSVEVLHVLNSIPITECSQLREYHGRT